MSLSSSVLPAASVVVGLGFVAAIHLFSAGQTEAEMARIAQVRAEQAAQRTREHEAFLAAYEARRAQARAAAAAAARQAMLASLPGDPKKGRLAFMTCMVCHGAKGEGNRAFNAPRLSGQAPWYIKRELEKFQQGLRGTDPRDVTGQQMAPMARILMGSAIDDVIAYVVTLEAARPPDAGTGDAAAGKAQFALCATCHGPAAAGLESQGGPALSHQHAWYLKRQIHNFRAGIRGASAADVEGQKMAAIALTLVDDKTVADVIAYIQSLGQ